MQTPNLAAHRFFLGNRKPRRKAGNAYHSELVANEGYSNPRPLMRGGIIHTVLAE